MSETGQSLFDSGNPAVDEANRNYAYLYAAVSGLVAGLVRSTPQLDSNEYWLLVVCGIASLLATLFFVVISTKDHRSRADRLFWCGAVAFLVFFVGVALNTIAMPDVGFFGVVQASDFASLLFPVLGVIIFGRLVSKAGFFYIWELPSAAAVVALVVIFIFINISRRWVF